MKRKILGVLLSISLVAAMLAGCSNNSSGSDSQTANDAQAEAPAEDNNGDASAADDNADIGTEAGGISGTVRWALWDYDTSQYYQALIDAYQAQNPDVTVELVDLASDNYQEVVQIHLSGGSDTYDLVTVKDIPMYASLVERGLVDSLDSYIDQEGIDKSLYSGITEQLEVSGNLYALPFRSDHWVIFYNRALFDEAGVDYPTNDMTWDEYKEIAEKMTYGEGVEKVYGTHYHTWRSTVTLGAILDGKNTIIDGTYDFIKPFYEMAMEQQDAGICMDYASLTTGSIHYRGVFYENQIAMLPMGIWFMPSQIEALETGESLSSDWGMVKYPHAEGVEAGTTLGTITSLAVNSSAANKEAALDFMKFVTGEEGAKILAEMGSMPAISNDEVVDLVSSIDGFPQDENSKEALYTVKTYLEFPLFEKASELEVILNEEHDNIMTGAAAIDEGIENMNSRVADLMAD